jgi:glycosyltransferase involved in cell wall biosynthesis
MKVAILTQYYPPEHGAPQNRLHDIARRWVEWGHEVTVLTAMPNYPLGEVFPEYRGQFSCREEIDGVKVIHSWIFVSKKEGKIAQLMSYLSFMVTSFIVGLLRLPRPDVMIWETPPLFLGASALALKLCKRTKLVTNVSDLWPESAVQLGMIRPGLALSTLKWFEKKAYQKSSLVTCQTEGIVAGVVERHPGAKTFLFPNGVDLDMFQPVMRCPNLVHELDIPNDAFVVGYGGNHGRSQALRQILAAAKQLHLRKPGKFLFILFGDGAEKEALVKQAEVEKIDNLRFYPSQPRQKMNAIQGLFDVALVPLRDIPLFDGARPSKMFELMAGQIPFVFCGRGEGAELAKESGCAKIVPPENPEALATALEALAALSPEQRLSMGKQARAYIEVHFNRARIARQLLDRIS